MSKGDSPGVRKGKSKAVASQEGLKKKKTELIRDRKPQKRRGKGSPFSIFYVFLFILLLEESSLTAKKRSKKFATGEIEKDLFLSEGRSLVLV